MSKRERMAPADVLFGTGRAAARAPAAPPAAAKNIKVAVYLPPQLLDDVDELRLDLRRRGVTVDRSALIAEALRLAVHDYADTLVERMGVED